MAATSEKIVDAASVEVLTPRRRPFPIGLAARYAVLIGTILLTIFPLVWLVITSLRIPADIFAVPVHIIPASATWRQYVNVFTQYNLAGYLWNTIVVSLATVVCVTVLAVPCAYAMARFRLPGHRIIVSLLLIMRMIPVVALAIPLFAVLASIGLLDILTSLILAHTAAKLPVVIPTLIFVWLAQGLLVKGLVTGTVRG
jgi:multiple sugar transport system permease protein